MSSGQDHKKELVMFGRSYPCPDQMRTERFLKRQNIPYRLVMIDEDQEAGAIVEHYVGHRSVPTMIIAQPGENRPVMEPAALPPGRSSRSYDRDTMITEPSDEAMHIFLTRNELI